MILIQLYMIRTQTRIFIHTNVNIQKTDLPSITIKDSFEKHLHKSARKDRWDRQRMLAYYVTAHCTLFTITEKMAAVPFTTMLCTLFFFYNNNVYKNNEAENGNILRIC